MISFRRVVILSVIYFAGCAVGVSYQLMTGLILGVILGFDLADLEALSERVSLLERLAFIQHEHETVNKELDDVIRQLREIDSSTVQSQGE